MSTNNVWNVLTCLMIFRYQAQLLDVSCIYIIYINIILDHKIPNTDCSNYFRSILYYNKAITSLYQQFKTVQYKISYSLKCDLDVRILFYMSTTLPMYDFVRMVLITFTTHMVPICRIIHR